MDLSIIIPSFNTKQLLQECLDSLKKNKGKLKIEIIVVDNGSTDKSVDYLKRASQDKGVKAIFLDQNWGFAGAVNKGIQQAKSKFILLLNSDTQIKKNTFKELIKFSKKRPEAIVGLQLVNLDDSIQPSVYHFPSLVRAVREFWFGQEGTYQKYAPKSEKPVEVDAVTGAAMLIPQKVIKKIGFLDEKYFFYFEDLDYCRRAKKAGFRVYYLPSAKVIHHHGAAGKEMPELTHQWLVESSQKYNGLLKYYLLTLVIKVGQRWRRLIGQN